MRFLPQGPNIPDELLEARDQGDVIFLCGAGVSQPDLPSFARLARQVIDALGCPSDAPSRMLLDRIEQGGMINAPLDEVFQNLKYEYGADAIDQLVTSLLNPAQQPSTEQHSVILRLSRSAAGHPQIVTTNFDLLFERVDPAIKISVAPVLPDLTLGQPLEGIVYLHGRLKAKSDDAQSTRLVVGSADFGRAYLAEGWATKFVANLLRYYTIVLIGYSANDPPVRYLLQGIHARAEERLTRIYTFDQGEPDVVEARWRDRGVTVIPYQKTEAGHAVLWETLTAWAARADNVDAWRQSVINLATRLPSELRPHERGQVYTLARTYAGTKLFRDNPTPPPAHWLCVFDRAIRLGKPRAPSKDEVPYDPVVWFGLDHDPVRPAADDKDEQDLLWVEDFLARLPHEEVVAGGGRMASWDSVRSVPVTARLFHLFHWLVRRLDDPALIWWVAGYPSLHPRLVLLIDWNLENRQTPLPALARQVWLLLLERFRQGPRDDFDAAWYAWVRQNKQDGWTHSVLREFARLMQPYWSCKRPGYGPSPPPTQPWDSITFNDLVHAEVKFLRRDPDNLEIPTKVLPEVFRVLRQGLEQAVGMLEDIDTDKAHWRTGTFILENGPAGQVHHGEFDAHLLWVVRLFDRLVKEHVDVARWEITQWPPDDPYVFNKFRLYAWRVKTLIDPAEVAQGVLSLPREVFRNYYQWRELLHLFASRWSELAPESRCLIEERIIVGRASIPGEDDAEYRRHAALTAARFLGWLQLQGCELSEATRHRLPDLRAADPRWSPAWDQTVAASGDARFYQVQLDKDPAQLKDVPIGELVPRAMELGGHEIGEHVRRDPFRGEVERRPLRAYRGLAFQARRQRFEPALWSTLLQSLPEGASERLRWTLATRLVRLPDTVVSEVLHPVSDWFRKNLPALAKTSLDQALVLWDGLRDLVLRSTVDPAKKDCEEPAGAVVGLADAPQNFERASTTPLGYLTDTLLTLFSDLGLAPGAGIPPTIGGRLEHLFAAPAPAGKIAVATTAASLTWLHHQDPTWTEGQLIPRFSSEHADADAAWSGYGFDSHPASPALFAKLKQPFLGELQALARQRSKEQALNHFADALVIYSFWQLEDPHYLSYAEVRAALQTITPKSRAHAAWRAVRIVKEHGNWTTFGKGFAEHAWPRELRFQSSATSNHLADLAVAAGDYFPEAVQVLLPVLMQVDHLHLLLREGEDAEIAGDPPPKLSRRYPGAFLALLDRLVGLNPRWAEYNLPAVLRTIVEAAPQLRQDPRWRRLNEIAVRG